jgi:hypothetical protein
LSAITYAATNAIGIVHTHRWTGRRSTRTGRHQPSREIAAHTNMADSARSLSARSIDDGGVHDIVNLAVENNAKWCDLVCRARGISTSWKRGFWVSRQTSPRLYPEAVTTRRRVSPERLISQLPRGRCSIKDSFADLDLTPHGFQPLFEAMWISRVAPARAGPGNGWAIVSEPGDVDAWLQACGLSDVLAVGFAREPSVRVAQLKPGAASWRVGY